MTAFIIKAVINFVKSFCETSQNNFQNDLSEQDQIVDCQGSQKNNIGGYKSLLNFSAKFLL